ncbi:MAG: TetR/AcrR family transcriptional regulator [Polyangiales bacterium]
MSMVRAAATRTEQKKEDKRLRLRDAAWDLFRDQGFEATTTKQIAERAGVASGTLFLYARDKGDLLFLVLHERLSQAVDDGMHTVPLDRPLLEQMLHLFERFFRVYQEAPGVARAFVRELPGADGPNAQKVNQLTMALLHHVAGLIQRAQAHGELDPEASPLLLAQNAFALYFMALLSWLSGFTTLEGALPMLRASLELQLRGLTR